MSMIELWLQISVMRSSSSPASFRRQLSYTICRQHLASDRHTHALEAVNLHEPT